VTVSAIGVSALAVICCAGVPLVGGLLGGLTLVAVLGVSGGLLAALAIAVAAVLAIRTRRRRARPTPSSEREVQR
jgi:hypothetical protein